MDKQGRDNLGKFIKGIIKRDKLKLRDIEFKSGGEITNSYISRITNGNVKNLSLDKLDALARGLGINAHELFTAAYGPPPAASVSKTEDQPVELGAVEFLTMMQKVAVEPDYIEIMKEVIQLWPEESKVMLESLKTINEKKRKSQTRKKPSRNAK